MRRIRRRTFWAGAVAALAGSSLAPWAARPAAQAGDEALWAALREGCAVALLRHASAPGTGDPPGFRLEDCGTQRNLSEAGRAEARAIGERFRRNGIDAAEVHSSQWCRCLETARLLGLGAVQPLPALNSFFADRAAGPGQTVAVSVFLAARESARPLVLVTHQVNIAALTGVAPPSGGIVVAAPTGDGSLTVLGRIPPPQ